MRKFIQVHYSQVLVSHKNVKGSLKPRENARESGEAPRTRVRSRVTSLDSPKIESLLVDQASDIK